MTPAERLGLVVAGCLGLYLAASAIISLISRAMSTRQGRRLDRRPR